MRIIKLAGKKIRVHIIVDEETGTIQYQPQEAYKPGCEKKWAFLKEGEEVISETKNPASMDRLVPKAPQIIIPEEEEKAKQERGILI